MIPCNTELVRTPGAVDDVRMAGPEDAWATSAAEWLPRVQPTECRAVVPGNNGVPVMPRPIPALLASVTLIAALQLAPPADRPLLAQTPSADSATAPTPDLSADQKQTIYQSVSTTEKNSTAPPGFRPSVGAHVPDMIELKPMPDTLARLIPAAKAYEVGMVEKQVILVEPASKTVVTVITHEE
jgi:hypothetical protein